MLQVFDRVFASRSVETLVMLSLAAALAGPTATLLRDTGQLRSFLISASRKLA
jgi:ABC-type protease/lipase transport system fused ATPase/permease subunit